MRRFLTPFVASLLLTFTIVLAWLFRFDLQDLMSQHPASLVAIVVGCAVLLAALAGILVLEGTAQHRAWLSRISTLEGLGSLKPPSVVSWITGRFPDPIERVAAPFFRTRLGQQMASEWEDAGFGNKPSRYLLWFLSASLFGAIFGNRIAGGLLGFTLILVLPIFPHQIVRTRALAARRRFSEQLPQALDALAAGMSAGLSLQQSIFHAQTEIPKPAGEVFARLGRRIALGKPIDEALRSLLIEQPDESLALVIDGVILQRQFGGDMVRMLEETADLLRQREQLEREVRAVTSQGRLSGAVIAALVPVSAGFLLAFNPRYIDVLFDTIIGQMMIVFAVILQLVGWAIISRMVRIRY